MTSPSDPPVRGAMEQAVTRPFPYLVGGLLASLPLLAVRSDNVLAVVIVQLVVVVGIGLLATDRIAPLSDGVWFAGFGWAPRTRRFFGAVVLVVIPTGLVALITLASSAALRFDPSLQFLQLLSALDIAWAGAALMLGIRWLWGRTASLLAGITLGVMCVYSIWNYLDVVGFGPGGSWSVDGGQLMRLVIPADVVAAVVAVTALLLGLRRRSATDLASRAG